MKATEFTIRPALPEDIPGLAKLLDEVDEEHHKFHPELFTIPDSPPRKEQEFLDMIASEDATILVAVKENTPVGLTMLLSGQVESHPVKVPVKFMLIDLITVARDQRKSGIGRALFHAAEQWAQQQGLDRIELKVYRKNKAALAFYESLGFKAEWSRMVKSATDQTS